MTPEPELAGAQQKPVTAIDICSIKLLDAMLAAPFKGFTFSPVSASVYQFGNYGTARKQLKAFPAKV